MSVKSYEVCSRSSSHSFGFYLGTSPEDAINACVVEAGYQSIKDMEAQLERPCDLMATRIATAPADSDEDDCLQAAAEKYAAAHGLKGWDLLPRWEDKHLRNTVVLSIPEFVAI
jgi:hypothetical protein